MVMAVLGAEAGGMSTRSGFAVQGRLMEPALLLHGLPGLAVTYPSTASSAGCR
jgi:hypothetical protein